MTVDPSRLAACLDSTNLRLDATSGDIRQLSEEALGLGCACVMIYPTSIPIAAEILRGSLVAVGTVIGFPSGRFSTEANLAEVRFAASAGAREVDVVMDYGALRDGRERDVAHSLSALASEAHHLNLLIKVITENCYLSEPQMLLALRLCEDAGVDFIKTSTGFGSAGATVEHVALWARTRTTPIRIKAAGGIRTLSDATALLAAGAARLGTSNAASLVSKARDLSAASASTGAY